MLADTSSERREIHMGVSERNVSRIFDAGTLYNV